MTGPPRGLAARGFALWERPFIRFLCVGALNTAFGYAVFFVLRQWLSSGVALALSFIAGVLFNFRTTGVLVFRSGDLRLIIRFVLVYVPIYFVNLALLSWLEWCGLNARLAQALCIPPVVVVTYAAMKLLVFRTNPAHGNATQESR